MITDEVYEHIVYAPPIVIISGDRELELFGRYEEQAYLIRNNDTSHF